MAIVLLASAALIMPSFFASAGSRSSDSPNMKERKALIEERLKQERQHWKRLNALRKETMADAKKTKQDSSKVNDLNYARKTQSGATKAVQDQYDAEVKAAGDKLRTSLQMAGGNADKKKAAEDAYNASEKAAREKRAAAIKAATDSSVQQSESQGK